MRSPYKERVLQETREREAEAEHLRQSAPPIFPYRKSSRPLYRWRITHPKHGSDEEIGAVRYDVVILAAKKWRVPWTSIAQECEFERLEEVART